MVSCAVQDVRPPLLLLSLTLLPPRQLRMCMGFGTLFYARSFPYTIVFCQAFQFNGLPQVRPQCSRESFGSTLAPCLDFVVSRLKLTSVNGSTAPDILRSWCVLVLYEALQGGQSVEQHQLVSPFPRCSRKIWGAIGT